MPAMLGAVRHWEAQLQIARRLFQVKVGSRWQWVGPAIADSWTPYNGGLKAALGCRLRRFVIGKCSCRLQEWRSEKNAQK